MPEPKRSRPHMQKEYGVPSKLAGMLPWSHVAEQLQQARNYWLVTVKPDGQPHAMPVWGVWVDDTLHFGMGRETRKARNLAANPKIVIHLDNSDAPVIIEGIAAEVLEPAQQARIDQAYEAKYGMPHGTPVFALRPRVAFAWTEFPQTATRWQFDS